MNATHFCKQCERPFKSKRPHAKYDTKECRYQGWIQQQVEAACQRVEDHPLAEARADQEASDLKSKLSQIIYEGIVDRLTQGPVHADDLEPLFPPEVRDVCRRLVGAQFGSLASRHYIYEKERRKSEVPSRKGAKSGVFKFTKLGRERLTVGHRAGGRGEPPQESTGVANATPSSVSDEQSAPRVSAGAPSPKGSDGAINKPDSSRCASVDSGGSSGVPSQAPEPAARPHEPLSLLPEPDPEAWAA